MTNAGAMQGRQIRAAVIHEKGGPFRVEALTLEEPRRDEVLVKSIASDMCHTDMVARDKVYDVPHPIVLGHEKAGIVERVGEDVVKVAPGDRVVLTYMWRGRRKPCYLGRVMYCGKTYPLCFGGAPKTEAPPRATAMERQFTITSSGSRPSELTLTRSQTSATP